ncbi:MAG: nitrite reductase, copper-containing [SAR202 cluster bacterium]|nr:nitrite reductase, copper-containing [SAR202 cluster bacterium]
MMLGRVAVLGFILVVAALALAGCSRVEPTERQTQASPPFAPPRTERSSPTTVRVSLTTTEKTLRLAEGVEYQFWTFNGTVPGPMLRIRQGDTVDLSLTNSPDSRAAHNIDLHAVNGPGGGAAVTTVIPGQTKSFSWRALNPGLYVYHCAVAPVAQHITNGMYGLVLVEPPGGLPPVDKEFYVMQGELYVQGKRGEKGLQSFSFDKLLTEQPDYVVFNGAVGALTGENALKARVGERVRIFFGVGGPNLVSSFHVIGEIFDVVYQEAASRAVTNVQTTLVPAGGATIVEFTLDVPGNYLLVDHSLSRLEKGALGILQVEGPEQPDIFRPTSGQVGTSH